MVFNEDEVETIKQLIEDHEALCVEYPNTYANHEKVAALKKRLEGL